MPELFLALPNSDQEELLKIHAEKLSMEPHIVEKDIWVCWALEQLFKIPDQRKMAFKGGTSLSKVYKAIDRFSEDIDVSFDYRTFTGELKSASRSQLSKITNQIKRDLLKYSRDVVKPYFEQCLKDQFRSDQYKIESDETGEKLYINYLSAVHRNGEQYIADKVLLEFGGRNMTDPNEQHRIKTYLSSTLSEFSLPESEVPVLALARTYWEKATLIHVACNRSEIKAAERTSRHWYDLFQLSVQPEQNETDAAIELLKEVVEHKSMFYHSSWANYQACIDGGLRLVPEGELRKVLEEDFKSMVKAGMFYTSPPKFDKILERLYEVQSRLNKVISEHR